MAGRLGHEQRRGECAGSAGAVHGGFKPDFSGAYRDGRAFQSNQRECFGHAQRNDHARKYLILAGGHAGGGSEPAALYVHGDSESAIEHYESTFVVAGKTGTTKPISSHGAVQHRGHGFR